jgi:hexokinase
MKNIPKESTHMPAKYKGERIMFDISSVQVTSHGGNKFWLLIMDEFTGFCWSYFLRQKSDLSNQMIDWVKAFNIKFNTKVKHLNVTIQVKIDILWMKSKR